MNAITNIVWILAIFLAGCKVVETTEHMTFPEPEPCGLAIANAFITLEDFYKVNGYLPEETSGTELLVQVNMNSCSDSEINIVYSRLDDHVGLFMCVPCGETTFTAIHRPVKVDNVGYTSKFGPYYGREFLTLEKRFLLSNNYIWEPVAPEVTPY